MKTVFPSHLLKSMLWLDAAVGAAVALLQLSAPGWLAGWLELPRALLVESSVLLLGFVALLLVLAASTRVWTALVWLIVLGNVGWAVGCLALLATQAVTPNALGAGFVLLHVGTVLLFANFEAVGLKRSAVAADAHVLRS